VIVAAPSSAPRVAFVAPWLAAALVACARLASGEESAASQPWYEAVQLNGFVSTSYSYNFNRPNSRINSFRIFDFDDDSFKLDVFELVAQKPASKPHETGFRADLVFGSSIPRVSAAAGLFRDDTGVAQDIDLQQAYATYVAPLGSGLKIDAGKFVTHCGYEVIEGYDGWNDNASRSFLFGFAIPFTHTGLRASYAVSPRLGATVLLVNGWDEARDNNRAKSVGAQLALAPLSTVALTVNVMTGAERPADDSHLRSLLDLVAIWKPSPQLTLGANADWGIDQEAVRPGADATWNGVAGYLRTSPNGTFALSIRGESFDDVDGSRTGIIQRLSDTTLTPEVRLSPALIVRGDLRLDHSSQSTFEKGSDFTDTQATVSVNALYTF